MAEGQKITLGMSLGIAVWITGTAAQATHSPVRVERVLEKPIITPQLHPSIGANIQGPSLGRVPDWVKTPLGKYYLYFADHKASYIRLAYADDLRGPWRIHPPWKFAARRFLFLDGTALCTA